MDMEETLTEMDNAVETTDPVESVDEPTQQAEPDAATDQETTDEPVAEVTETEPVADAGTQPEPSYLTDADDEQEAAETDDTDDRFVPVSAIQKERQKRQAAEQRLKALEQQQQRKAGPDGFEDELQGLINDPDELIDGKTVIKLLNQSGQRVAQEVRESMKAEQQANAEKEAAKQQLTALRNSEAQARKQFSDFDAVVSKGVAYMTPDELASIRRSANPGAILYRKSKEVLTMMGVQPSETVQKPENQPPATPPAPAEEPSAETEQTDEDIYADVFGGEDG